MGNFGAEQIRHLCHFIGAPLYAFCEGSDGVKLLFVIPQSQAETILPRIQKAREMLEQDRPAGVRFILIYRFLEGPAIEAAAAMERLVGTDEVLKQVFELEPDGEWR